MAKFIFFLKITLQITSPMIMAAKPITIAPRPLLTFAWPLNCAYKAPAKATNAFDITRPIVFIIFILIPCAFAMAGFVPVALRAEPISVPKNAYITAIIATAIIATVISASF